MFARSLGLIIGLPLVVIVMGLVLVQTNSLGLASVAALITLYGVYRTLYGGISDAKSAAKKWRRDVAHCRYVHAFNGDGIALDTNARQLHLCVRQRGGVFARSYPLSDVREWSWSIGQADYNGTVGQNLGSIAAAKRDTGFWVRVRDVDNPKWFIHFAWNSRVETELERWREIMRQAFE